MRGDGSIKQLKGHRYWYAVFAGPKTESNPRGYYRENTGCLVDSEKSKRDAETYLRRRVREVRNDADGLSPFVAVVNSTFTDEADSLEKFHLAGKLSDRTATCHLKHARCLLGPMKIRDIRASTLERYQRTRLSEGAAKATVDNEVGLIVQALGRAFEDGRLAKVPKVKKLLSKHENARQGFTEPAEFYSLLEVLVAADEDFADFIEWFWWTGMREGETGSLTFSHLRSAGAYEEIVLPAANAKTPRPRVIPIVGPLAEIIERRRARRITETPLVFHSSGYRITKDRRTGGLREKFYSIWDSGCAKVGLTGLDVYDLRRCAARNLVNAGVPEIIARKITGHATGDMFARYAITSSEDIAKALENVAAHVQRESKRKKILPFAHKG